MAEGKYQAGLIKRIRSRFPGCVIIKNDTGYMQGIPDLLVLCRDRWAVLEVKDHEDAPLRPNQDYYVRILNEMSFAAFIYPSNEEDVLRELERAFKPLRSARVS